jgi:peptidoglycan-N-acetylmuramic acid deacetylase
MIGAALTTAALLTGRGALANSPFPPAAMRQTATEATQIVPLEIQRGPRTERAVALTFDDGPYAGDTARILDVLKQEKIHATFFVTGEHALAHPELVKRMVAEGNEVGNHTYDHHYYERLTSQQVAEELEKTRAVILQLTGKHPTLSRPPGFHYSERDLLISQALGMTTVFGDISTGGGDPIRFPGDPEAQGHWMAKQMLRLARPGAIIVMHDSAYGMADGLRETIERLKTEGYTFETPQQMLEHRLQKYELTVGPGNRVIRPISPALGADWKKVLTSLTHPLAA